MKKIIFALVILTTVSQAFAQGRNRIDRRDGRSTVRIVVGDMNNAQLANRVRNLEEAVRDLQQEVYDIREDQQQPTLRQMHVCSVKTAFDGTFLGKASSRTEASALARNKCEQARAFNCGNIAPVCETVME